MRIQSVNELLRSLQQNEITQYDCEELWTYYHLLRIKQHTSFINSLEQSKVDQIDEEHPSNNCIQDDVYNQQFNVLKQSVRTNKYNKQLLFDELEKVNQTKIAHDKPMKYCVNFKPDGTPVISESILNEEDITNIMKNQIPQSFFDEQNQSVDSQQEDSQDSDDEDYMEQQRREIKQK